MSDKKGNTLPGGQNCFDALQCIKKEIECIELERKNMHPTQFAKDVDNMLRIAKGKLNTLEQLELKNVQTSSVLELDRSVKSLKNKMDDLKMQERRKTQVMNDIKNHNFTFRTVRPLSGFKNNLRFLRRGIVGRVERFQDRLGDFVGYFFVFLFGYQTWGKSFSNLFWDSLGLMCGIIESWKMELQNETLARKPTQRRGLIRGFLSFWWSWTFGWYSWCKHLAKQLVVGVYDYLSPILRQNETFDKKVLHIYHDAKDQIPGGIKQSLVKGTHYAMAPMEYVASNLPQGNIKKELLNVIETIDPLSKTPTEIKLQQKQRRRSATGVEATQSMAR